MSPAASGAGKLAALLGKDARGVARDGFLLFMLGYGILIAGLLRILAPRVPLDDFGLLVAPAAPLIAALLAGDVLGFSLIEEREARTWLLLRVLPLPERSLQGYLIGAATALGLASAGLATAVYGQPIVRPWLFGWALLACAQSTPLMMLFLGAFASNKIEGLALGKLSGIVTAAPILAFVVPAPWHRLLWWDPWYWLYLALLRSQASDDALAAAPVLMPSLSDAALVAIPIALSLVACAWLVRRFRRVAA